jgi:hypothetical protein
MNSRFDRRNDIRTGMKPLSWAAIEAQVNRSETDIHSDALQDIGPNPTQRQIQGAVLQALARHTDLTLLDVLELQATLGPIQPEGDAEQRIDETISCVIEAVERWGKC